MIIFILYKLIHNFHLVTEPFHQKNEKELNSKRAWNKYQYHPFFKQFIVFQQNICPSKYFNLSNRGSRLVNRGNNN